MADKGYPSRANRAWLRERGIAATIPERDDQIAHRRKRRGRPIDFGDEQRHRYRGRNVVERCFNLTRAKLVRDARGDGVEDGLRRVAGWGLRYDLVPVDADRDVSQRSQGADDLADARPGEVLEMA